MARDKVPHHDPAALPDDVEAQYPLADQPGPQSLVEFQRLFATEEQVSLLEKVKAVLIVYDFAYLNGGQARVAIESAIALAQQTDLTVIYFAACGPVDPRLLEAGVEVVCLDQHDILHDPNRRRAALNGIWNSAAARRLAEILRQLDPKTTIVHCHGFAKALSAAIGPIITGVGVRHLFTMHEYFLLCPNGGFFHYPEGEICHRPPMGLGCLGTNCDSRSRAHKAWRVARQAIIHTFGAMPRRLRELVVLSETQRRAMARYLPRGARIWSLRNPVATEMLPRVLVETNRLFLFIGRLAPEKAPVVLAEAARQAQVQTVFVGDGDQRDAVIAANPAAQVTGWLSPDQVAPWLEQARCLVLPGKWSETFALVAYEATARGVPVICGSWSAAAELVQECESGWLMENGSVTELTAVLHRAHDEAEEKSRQGYDAYWRNPRSMEQHLAGLLRVYEQVEGWPS